MKSIYEQMGGTYKQCGDYLIPDLTILEEKFTIGKYGRARERYLKEYRRCHYSYLLSTGNLSEHLHEVDVQARKILKQFKINLLFAWMRAKIGHCVMNEKRV